MSHPHTSAVDAPHDARRARRSIRRAVLPAAAALVAMTASAGFAAQDHPAASKFDAHRTAVTTTSALDNGPATYETWYDPQRAVRDGSGDAKPLPGSSATFAPAADLGGMDAYLKTEYSGHSFPTRFLHINVARAGAPASGSDYWGEHDTTMTFTWNTSRGKTVTPHRSTLVETWRSTGMWTLAIGHRVTTDGQPTDVTSEAAGQNAACGWVRDTGSTRFQHFAIPVRCIGSGANPVKISVKLTTYVDTHAQPGVGAADTAAFVHPLVLNGSRSYPTSTSAHAITNTAATSPVSQTLSQTADGKTIVFTQRWATPQKLEASPQKLSWHFLHEYDSFDYSVFPLDQVDQSGTVVRKMVAHWWDNRSATGGGGEWGCGAAETKYTVSSDRKSVRMTLPWRCLPWDTVRISTVYDGPSATIHRR